MTYEPETPPPAPVPPSPYAQPVEPNRQGFAIASLVVGILNLCFWIIPICGGPTAVIGLILGYLGLKSTARGMAIAGIVLSAIALILAIINGIAGIFLLNDLNLNQYMP
ncbi:MAG TPA: DUF4190 domain-containing protein [Anaerolineaceae bacterium]|nr:DUF4190 domain-containing protein [Anaerolineaceae bacterium]